MHIYVHVWAKTSYLLARQGLGGLTAETHSTDLQCVISSKLHDLDQAILRVSFKMIKDTTSNNC